VKYSVFECVAFICTFTVLKILFLGLSSPEAICLIGIVFGLCLAHVVSYYFPKQPDLFKEMFELKRVVDSISNRHDQMESELTGIKFGVAKK